MPLLQFLIFELELAELGGLLGRAAHHRPGDHGLVVGVVVGLADQSSFSLAGVGVVFLLKIEVCVLQNPLSFSQLLDLIDCFCMLP